MVTIRSDWDRDVGHRKFAGSSKNFFYVRIYLEGTTEELDKIRLVKYTLHPTFVDPVRVSDSRAANFEIKIWTYGYFDILASVFKNDGSSEDIKGYVKWDIPAGVRFDDDDEMPQDKDAMAAEAASRSSAANESSAGAVPAEARPPEEAAPATTNDIATQVIEKAVAEGKSPEEIVAQILQKVADQTAEAVAGEPAQAVAQETEEVTAQ